MIKRGDTYNILIMIICIINKSIIFQQPLPRYLATPPRHLPNSPSLVSKQPLPRYLATPSLVTQQSPPSLSSNSSLAIQRPLPATQQPPGTTPGNLATPFLVIKPLPRNPIPRYLATHPASLVLQQLLPRYLATPSLVTQQPLPRYLATYHPLTSEPLHIYLATYPPLPSNPLPRQRVIIIFLYPSDSISPEEV